MCVIFFIIDATNFLRSYLCKPTLLEGMQPSHANLLLRSFALLFSVICFNQAMRGGGSGLNDSGVKKGRTAALTAAQIKAELKARSSSRGGGSPSGDTSGGGGENDDEFDQVFLAEMHASRRAAELQAKRRALRMKSSSRADRSLGLGSAQSPSFQGDDPGGGGGLFTLEENGGGGDAWGSAGPWAEGGASSTSNTTKGSELRSMLPWASSSSSKKNKGANSKKKAGAGGGEASTHEVIEAQVMDDHNDDASVKAYEATLAKVIVLVLVLTVFEVHFRGALSR